MTNYIIQQNLNSNDCKILLQFIIAFHKFISRSDKLLLHFFYIQKYTFKLNYLKYS